MRKPPPFARQMTDRRGHTARTRVGPALAGRGRSWGRSDANRLGTALGSATAPPGASGSLTPTLREPVRRTPERSPAEAGREATAIDGQHQRATDGHHRWRLVAVAGLAIFMAQLDTTIVNVALPAIENDLGVTTSVTQWVVLAYLVPLIGFSLLAGRWLDAIGHRAALSIAVVGFTGSSVAAGAATSAALLISARATQGAFAALLLSLAPVLAVKAVGTEARGRALGVVGTLAPLGAMSGPVVGGQLVEVLGWPWIFYINVPVALVIIALGWTGLPAGPRMQLPQRAWLAEAAILGTAAVSALLAATFAVGEGWAWAAIALVAPPLVVVWRRMDTSRPIRSLISSPGMTAVHVSFASSYTVLLLVQFLTPFFLARTLDASPTVTGLTLLALPAATAALGVAGGALADRFGTRRVALIGAGVIAIGAALLLPLSGLWTPGSMAWRLAILGVGFGLFMTPTTSLAMGLAPRGLLGVTSASTNLARYLGLAIGPALATASWAAAGYRIEGMRIAVAVAVVVSLVTIAALARARHEPPRHPKPPRPEAAARPAAVPSPREPARAHRQGRGSGDDNVHEPVAPARHGGTPVRR